MTFHLNVQDNNDDVLVYVTKPTLVITHVHCVSKKNIPDVFSYNSRKHWRIFI